MRKTILKLVATILGVAISFPPTKIQSPEPRNKDYRLSRQVLYDGTVQWVVEQFVSDRRTLDSLYPGHSVDEKLELGGWITLLPKFISEGEAIRFLNKSLRAKEVCEVNHYRIS